MYIFTVLLLCLAAGVSLQCDFKVSQPQNQTVNSDGSVIISCEHNARTCSLEDVRLYRLSPKGKPKKHLVCQKGMKTCQNAFLQIQNPNKCLFILINIGLKAMDEEYQCEFTLTENQLDYTVIGAPTQLLPSNQAIYSQPPPPPLPPPPPPPGHSSWTYENLSWILIILLALLFLYSCVITTLLIMIKRKRKKEPENAYVVMRTGSVYSHPSDHVYSGC